MAMTIHWTGLDENDAKGFDCQYHYTAIRFDSEICAIERTCWNGSLKIHLREAEKNGNGVCHYRNVMNEKKNGYIGFDNWKWQEQIYTYAKRHTRQPMFATRIFQWPLFIICFDISRIPFFVFVVVVVVGVAAFVFVIPYFAIYFRRLTSVNFEVQFGDVNFHLFNIISSELQFTCSIWFIYLC